MRAARLYALADLAANSPTLGLPTAAMKEAGAKALAGIMESQVLKFEDGAALIFNAMVEALEGEASAATSQPVDYVRARIDFGGIV